MSPGKGASRPQRASLIPVMALVAVALSLGLAASSLVPALVLRVQQQQELARVRRDLVAAKLQNRQLTEEVARLSDPAYIEILARSRYNLAKKGEHVYSMIDVPAPSSAASSSADASSAPGAPWWRSVLRWIGGR